jgi:N-acetylglucosamine-6-phosphate deacetylase
LVGRSETLFVGGRVAASGREERGLPVLVRGGRIAAVGAAARRAGRRAKRVDLAGAVLVPGLVDIHTHGAAGIDFYRASAAEIDGALTGHYLARGVTSLLVSLYPGPRTELLEAVGRVARAIRDGVGRGIAAGIHLEGPFLSPRKPGALPRDSFSPVDLELAGALIDAGSGTLRTQTVAPELEGAGDLIRLLRKARVRPFLGHTACDFAGAAGAFRSGVRAVTHLWNAMEPIHHRAPGPAAAALLDERVSVEVIADGFHLDREALRLAARLKPPGRVCLVSDSVAPCGLAEGRYTFAGAPVRLEGGRVTLLDGTLAGSALTLDRALRFMVEEAGVGLADAVTMATEAPADAAGLRGVGRIAPGFRADLVVLDRRLRVREVYLAGELAYEAR